MTKPRFLRRNFACPDCGLLPPTSEVELILGGAAKPFDCERCKVHYPAEEFIELNEDKWSKEMKEEDPE